jgi:hypothetical protein
MGYEHRVYKTACGYCATEWLLTQTSWKRRRFLPRTYTCDSCGATNTTTSPRLYPNIPRVVYCGHEKTKQLEIYAYPPEHAGSEWAQPYSIRSFVYQTSQQIPMPECRYEYGGHSAMMGEPVHTDYCAVYDPGDGEADHRERCHLLSGWIRGKDTCPLWEKLKTYCQTISEQRFLWAYLSLVKGRDFPMLLPQVRVGIAERRRPDFVMFTPIHYLSYRRFAIELDGAHSPDHADADDARDIDLAAENYEVLSLRPNERGYFPEVQKLVERIAVEMTEANRSAWELATEVDNATFTRPPQVNDEDIPF